MTNAKIIIGGIEYSGWRDLDIARSMSSLCGTFSFTITNPKLTTGKFIVAPAGSKIEIKEGDDLVMTGYIDGINAGLDPTTDDVQIFGRDITEDIVDCSVPITKSLNKINFRKLVETLVAPYGIGVDFGSLQYDDTFKFTPAKGQKIWDVISKKANEFGYLLTTTPEGKIKVTNTTTENIAMSLIEGQNIERVSYSINNNDRFQIYRVIGQKKAGGFSWENNLNLEGVSRDDTIRFRELVINSSGSATQKSIARHADWENSTRRGLAESVGITVTGWRKSSDNKIWSINESIWVDVPKFDIAKKMVIMETNFKQSDSGSFTGLTLVPPETFQRIA